MDGIVQQGAFWQSLACDMYWLLKTARMQPKRAGNYVGQPLRTRANTNTHADKRKRKHAHADAYAKIQKQHERTDHKQKHTQTQ